MTNGRRLDILRHPGMTREGQCLLSHRHHQDRGIRLRRIRGRLRRTDLLAQLVPRRAHLAGFLLPETSTTNIRVILLLSRARHHRRRQGETRVSSLSRPVQLSHALATVGHCLSRMRLLMFRTIPHQHTSHLPVQHILLLRQCHRLAVCILPLQHIPRLRCLILLRRHPTGLSVPIILPQWNLCSLLVHCTPLQLVLLPLRPRTIPNHHLSMLYLPAHCTLIRLHRCLQQLDHLRLRQWHPHPPSCTRLVQRLPTPIGRVQRRHSRAALPPLL